MGKCANASNTHFQEPTKEQINAIGPGCFVQVNYRGHCCWIEVTEMNGHDCIGVIHPELSCDDNKGKFPTSKVQFSTEQVNALGCERYCSCD